MKSNGKLGLAIIGAGAQGAGVHIVGCASRWDAELVAVADIQQSKLDRVTERYKIPYSFLDYHDVLGLPEVDAVIVALPNYLHAPVSIEALSAGKHVLVEKPMALNASEAQQMLEASKKAGRLLLVGQNNRFTRESQFAKEFIEAGECGEIYMAEASWWRRRCGQRGWFIDKKRSGGGALVP